MDYWVTRKGFVYKGDYPDFHKQFGIDYFDQLDDDRQQEVLEWFEKNQTKTIINYLEEVKGWVWFVSSVVGGAWVISTKDTPSSEQVETMEKLTGFKF